MDVEALIPMQMYSFRWCHCFFSTMKVASMVMPFFMAGCNLAPVKAIQEFKKPLQDASQHLGRVSKHTGLYSQIEENTDQTGTIRLRVEGNSFVPTLDTERTFDEEMAKYCLTHPRSNELPQPVHVLSKEAKIINTWHGSIFEVRGTFRCETIQPVLVPLNPPAPPSKLPPFTLDLNKTSKAEKKKIKYKKPSQRKKGCNCIIPPEKNNKIEPKPSGVPAVPSGTTPKGVPPQLLSPSSPRTT